MKKLFEKYETWFCMGMIALYVVTNSFCMQNFGLEDHRTALVNTVFSVGLVLLVIALRGTVYYGLTGVKNAKRFLFFIPLVLIVSVNLWNGIHLNRTPGQIFFYVLSMLNVGLIEELVFRGFLFRMMAKDHLRLAVAVSSLTFGIGHIVNLLNGAELLPTLFQVCYATAIGYLFVVIFLKSGSLIPCILAHSVNNALSVFHEENAFTRYAVPVFLTVVPILYALYLQKNVPDERSAL